MELISYIKFRQMVLHRIYDLGEDMFNFIQA
jgi:hypothetical protein